MMKRITLKALRIGIVVMAAELVLAGIAQLLGYGKLASWIYWQNNLLQSFAPMPNLGTPDHPIYEGSPINFVLFFVAMLTGMVIYGAIAYLVLRKRSAVSNSNA